MNLKVTIAIGLFTVLTVACGTKLNSMRDADLKPRNTPVAVGEIAPDFTLEDQNNRKVTLSSARGAAPTVLVFYRGNW